MQIKFRFLLFSLSFPVLVFCQESPEQKDSIAKSLAPVEGKAIVYLIRSGFAGALIKMNLYCDSVHIGSTKAKNYVYTVVSPGHHTFLSKAENKAELELTAEAGKIYYIEQKSKMGILYARTGLVLLEDEKGSQSLGKCQLSKDNEYPGNP